MPLPLAEGVTALAKLSQPLKAKLDPGQCGSNKADGLFDHMMPDKDVTHHAAISPFPLTSPVDQAKRCGAFWSVQKEGR
jgi:hypothetical protein